MINFLYTVLAILGSLLVINFIYYLFDEFISQRGNKQ